MSITIDAMGHKYPENYKNDIFWIWYKAGKPGVYSLYNLIPEDYSGKRPSKQPTLRDWLVEFKERAKEYDEIVEDQMKARLVQSKVEMLERHAKVGEDLQKIGFDVIENSKGDITTATAVRMVIDGVRIERESKGIPDMLAKFADMSDEKLMKEIQQLTSKAPTEIEMLEGKFEDAE